MSSEFGGSLPTNSRALFQRLTEDVCLTLTMLPLTPANGPSATVQRVAKATGGVAARSRSDLMLLYDGLRGNL
jgi:hypothetical protein